LYTPLFVSIFEHGRLEASAQNAAQRYIRLHYSWITEHLDTPFKTVIYGYNLCFHFVNRDRLIKNPLSYSVFESLINQKRALPYDWMRAGAASY